MHSGGDAHNKSTLPFAAGAMSSGRPKVSLVVIEQMLQADTGQNYSWNLKFINPAANSELQLLQAELT
jgi:hypothetical protein